MNLSRNTGEKFGTKLLPFLRHLLLVAAVATWLLSSVVLAHPLVMAKVSSGGQRLSFDDNAGDGVGAGGHTDFGSVTDVAAAGA